MDSEEGISLDKAVPIVAVHLGVIDENMINDMSYVFFEDVLEQLGHKLIYDAVVNYAGNGFCDKSWDMITENNPLSIAVGGRVNKAMDALVNIFNSADVRIIKKDEGEQHEA